MITLFSSYFCILFSLIVLHPLATPIEAQSINNETDRLALLEFKSKITDDPFGVFDSWNNTLHFCNWYGVTCGRRHQRVTVLNLSSQRLVGTLSPHIGNLTFLRYLTIVNNSFTGQIPGEVGRLSRLKYVSMRSNSLNGTLPPALGRSKSLAWIDFGDNELEGTIPPSVFNLSSIQVFSIGMNRLSGSLPTESAIFSPNLVYFGLFGNQFTGYIPPSLSNASNLDQLGISGNNFIGQVPNLENLGQLRWFSILANQLGSAGKEGTTKDLEFLSTLANNTNIEKINAGINNFGGMFPDFISNFSFPKLNSFTMEQNQIVGTLPKGIGNVESLEVLYIAGNRLSGRIPEDIGKLHMLKKLYLNQNDFVGNIPSFVGNLSMLIELVLSENKLQGRIPSSIGQYQQLTSLDLSYNNLNGSIPAQVFTILSLSIFLDLSSNQFTGALPSKVGDLKKLGILDVSHNMLSGEIPTSLGGCESLEDLAMGANRFHGGIPPSFKYLRALKRLNLSRNNMSGEIPNYLQEFKLETLDLSFNSFSGALPTGGIFKNASADSFEGNDMLCGGSAELRLPICKTKKRRMIWTTKIIVVIVVSCIAMLCAFSFLLLWSFRKKNAKTALSSSEDSMLQVSYKSLFDATDGFSEANLIGKGSFSSVYKGILDLQRVVAVKVFNLQRKGASRSFLLECEALKNIRHRNLLKVITVCSSIDFHGDDFKALVYEFMANGNLDQWLHPSPDSTRKLDLAQRLDIAVGVASALNYLHHEYHQTSIIHCDLKPSNILLDDVMMAKVGDFGLAKFLSEETNHLSASSLGVRGTVGYAAPEYGMGSDVSADGDIYSFGILLLEMFTGKRPTDDMFDSNMNIHNYVKQALSENVAEITEAVLVEDDADKIMKSLIAIYEIGVACSQEIPKQRMDISDAVARLIVIRDNHQQQQQPQQVPRRRPA